MGADPGLDEGGDVLGHPRDEAVGLVVHQVKLFGHLVVAAAVVVVVLRRSRHGTKEGGSKTKGDERGDTFTYIESGETETGSGQGTEGRGSIFFTLFWLLCIERTGVVWISLCLVFCDWDRTSHLGLFVHIFCFTSMTLFGFGLAHEIRQLQVLVRPARRERLDKMLSRCRVA